MRRRTFTPQESKQSILNRLESNHTYVNDCKVWTGALNENGYGELTIRDESGRKKKEKVHRLSFQLENGYLPAVVRHTCDNPPCFRASHLVGGEHADNVADRVLRERSAIGTDNGRSKLSEVDVIRIYTLNDSTANLSRYYQVDGKVIRNIKCEEVWKSTIDAFKQGTTWEVTNHSYDPDTNEIYVHSEIISW